MSLQDLSPGDWGDPFEIDRSVAHPARRYNYWLGGKDNFEADRASGDALAAAFPTVRIAARENRCFLRRAVTYLVKEAGIRQFLDIGTGIPSADNVHEVAQSIDPKTRVVYVDNDPIVLAHARRLLAGSSSGATAYIHADLRDPDAILGHAELRKTLDLSEPIALMLVAVLHFFDDTHDPHGRVATLTDALAAGSHLVISHGTADFMSSEMKAKIDAINGQDWGRRARDPLLFRDKAEVARFFDGMELVPPGIESISDWRGDALRDQRIAAADTACYGAVARIR